MRSLIAALAAAAILSSLPAVAHASTLTYSESATVSGSLNGNAFTNLLISFSGSADTSAVQQPGLFLFAVPTSSTQFTLAGLGSFVITDSIQFFSNTFFTAGGITDLAPGGSDILDTQNSSFSSYNLKTAFGPVSGSSIISAGTPINSTDGKLILTRAGDSTFQVTAGATPEPSSLLLLATGSLGLIAAFRRRSTPSPLSSIG